MGVDRWTKRARERPTVELAACGVASFERSGLRGVCMKTKLTDTLDYSKTLDFNHHDLVDNIAIFTALALFQQGNAFRSQGASGSDFVSSRSLD